MPGAAPPYCPGRWSLVAGDVASGRLSNWGKVLNRPIEVWVLHASTRLSSPKVTSFVSFLAPSSRAAGWW